jgi:hypothetical protein
VAYVAGRTVWVRAELLRHGHAVPYCSLERSRLVALIRYTRSPSIEINACAELANAVGGNTVLSG